MRIRARGGGGWRRIICAGNEAFVERRHEFEMELFAHARSARSCCARATRQEGPFINGGCRGASSGFASSGTFHWKSGEARDLRGGLRAHPSRWEGAGHAFAIRQPARRRAVAILHARRAAARGRVGRDEGGGRSTLVAPQRLSRSPCPYGSPRAVGSFALFRAVPSNQDPASAPPERDPHNQSLQRTRYVGRPFGAPSFAHR